MTRCTARPSRCRSSSTIRYSRTLDRNRRTNKVDNDAPSRTHFAMHSKRASALLVLITSGDSGTNHRKVARALDVAALLWGIERMVVIAAAVVLLLLLVVVVVVVVLYVGSGRHIVHPRQIHSEYSATCANLWVRH